MKKGFAEPVSCSAIRERPTHYKEEGIQPFDVGKQGNGSPFWAVACTCAEWHRWLHRSSRQRPICFTWTWELWQHHLSACTRTGCWKTQAGQAGLPDYHQHALPGGLPLPWLLCPRELQHTPRSSNTSYLKPRFTSDPYRSFQWTHNWWKMSQETPS